MHLIQFREIMRDAEIAYAIHPIVLKYLLTVEETTKALLACGVSRAANVAQISTSFTFRESRGNQFRKVFPPLRSPAPMSAFTKLGPAVIGAALISSPMRCHSVGCGKLSRTTQ